MNALESSPAPSIATAPSTGTPRRKGNKLALLFIRIPMLILVTYAFGWVLHRSAAASNESSQPAGFARGMLHGALMPGAMPTLLLGKDVQIYSLNNTGRTYKLGYTFGVNACGALFFGGFYFRLMRWRKAYGKT